MCASPEVTIRYLQWFQPRAYLPSGGMYRSRIVLAIAGKEQPGENKTTEHMYPARPPYQVADKRGFGGEAKPSAEAAAATLSSNKQE